MKLTDEVFGQKENERIAKRMREFYNEEINRLEDEWKRCQDKMTDTIQYTKDLRIRLNELYNPFKVGDSVTIDYVSNYKRHTEFAGRTYEIEETKCIYSTCYGGLYVDGDYVYLGIFNTDMFNGKVYIDKDNKVCLITDIATNGVGGY